VVPYLSPRVVRAGVAGIPGLALPAAGR